VVWLAVGLGLLLLPEASRRVAQGRDARALLAGCAAAVVAATLALLAVLAAVGPSLVRLFFGSDYEVSRALLLTLATAMGALAVSMLCTQYLLALRRVHFLMPLAAAAVAVVPAMAIAGPSIDAMALALLVTPALLCAGLAVVVLLTPTKIRRA
jgi:O-antigen/teichoic acid export membrane protein